MGYTDLAHLTHLMENVLDAIRNGEMPVTSDLFPTAAAFRYMSVSALYFHQ
jgi:chemotaxis protein histidine kinase CheA